MRHPKPKEFDAAYNLYRQSPTHENGLILLRFTGDWIRTREMAMLGPSIGIFDTLNERQHFASAWGARLIQKHLPGFLRRYLKADCPGWNDYYMCRWQLTKQDRHADELHRRVKHLHPATEDWRMVEFTACWMVDSCRSQDSAFDAAMLLAETRCWICSVQG